MADFPHRDEADIHARARHATHHERGYDEHLHFDDERGKVHRRYHPAGKNVSPVVVGPHDWAAYEADPKNYEPDYLRFDETVTKPAKKG